MTMARIDENNGITLRHPGQANHIVDSLNADVEDYFTYEVEPRGKYAAIKVSDENGEFIAYL